MICKVVSPAGYNLQQQRQQRLIDNINNNKKNRILIVDDQKRYNKSTLLKLDLERNGFIVDTFTDPLVALDNFRAGLFDMVVLDKRMSKMNAIDLHKMFSDWCGIKKALSILIPITYVTIELNRLE
jgi:DNA-binding NtrC family response regulator